MKNNQHISFILLINLLAGLSVSLITGLLIYFKQKPVLHHTILLVLIALLYVFYFFFRERIQKVNNILEIISLSFIMLLSWLGPQFIYQIRPYTFYISGYSMLCILVILICTLIVSSIKLEKRPWIFINLPAWPLMFLLGYGIGYLLSPDTLQYLIMGFSSILIVFYLFANQSHLVFKSTLVGAMMLSAMVFWSFSTRLLLFTEQPTYEDKVVFSSKTQHHDLVITQWHHNYWYFIDQLKNLSSIDEYLYYEPMVHSVFDVPAQSEKALVLGGENGCLIREVLKYDRLNRVDVISYDTLLRNLGMVNPYFTQVNKHAYNHEKVHIIHKDLLQYISTAKQKYDLIFIDLPDPRSIESNQYYTLEFYRLMRNLLSDQGVMITQAGSPYFATEAFYAIGKTIQSSGFHTLPIHNQILTLGEWGWYICSKDQSAEQLKKILLSAKKRTIQTRWYNQEAAQLISSFGKTNHELVEVPINTLENPLVYKYYLKGNWDLN